MVGDPVYSKRTKVNFFGTVVNEFQKEDSVTQCRSSGIQITEFV